MAKITLEKLLKEDLLYIDKEIHALPVTSETLQELSGGGVYVFKDKDRQILYVGITDDLKRRISAHLNGYGSQDIFNLKKDDLIIEFFNEENVIYRDIYESYLIHQLKPRYNISKTSKAKRRA